MLCKSRRRNVRIVDGSMQVAREPEPGSRTEDWVVEAEFEG